MGGRAHRVAPPAGRRDAGSRAGHDPPDSPIYQVVPVFEPESDMERRLAGDRELIGGLAWGSPRPSHPEGSVGQHVSELLRTLDAWGETGSRRADLRFLALIHDSLKRRVDPSLPKRGGNHHAMRARHFAERYTDDERLLAVLEMHDRPYALWRRLSRTGRLQEERLEEMIRALPDPGLFMRFVELDGYTTGKWDEPVRWLRSELERRGVSLESPDPP
jgi:hypothetical protein